jgi:large subunit ribosomal protein L29
MKTADIREMSAEERLAKLEALKEELFQMRVRKRTGSLDNPVRLRIVRRDIARILTVENQLRTQTAKVEN